jgi:prepilin-type processing-associated H-X9-DG protein
MQNTKQQAMAINLFTLDHDDTMPVGSQWTDRVAPYIEKDAIFNCAQGKSLNGRTSRGCGYVEKCGSDGQKTDESFGENITALTGYAYNSSLSGVVKSEIADPTGTVLTFDAVKLLRRPAAEPIPVPGAFLANYSTNFSLARTQGFHDGGTIVSFVDCHAAWKSDANTRQLQEQEAKRNLLIKTIGRITSL